MSASSAEVQGALTLPEVGDLVTENKTHAKWVCTDIEASGGPAARWVLRPLFGGGADGQRTRKLHPVDVQAYSVLRRRGEWTQL
ncbi:hypothetical protein ACFC0M_12370 [Streptomyces sp. NPDC056149]|uniref:hypothetical protein n=1 Tax=Streptomyces sp. NPDC056149 TaxID=3345728 RepID=UPI0035E200B7